MLVTDAYGGLGGIAAYNRDVAAAMCADPNTCEVIAIGRSGSDTIGEIPQKLTYTVARGGATGYVAAVMLQVAKRRFDLVYCAHVNLAPIALIAAKLTGAPWILATYGIEAWQPSPRRSVAFAECRADHVVSISSLTLKRFLSFSHYAPERTSILPNAIHLDRFGIRPPNSELAERLGIRGKTVLLTLGRMEQSERYKGFDELIEIIPDLARDLPNLVYVAAGEGSDRPRLQAKARRLGIRDRVIFPGFIEETEKADLYRLADVYAMPSSGEGFGFVFLEALACGTPVVASATDGGREAVLDGNLGRIVDPEDPAALRSAILAAIGEPRRVDPRLAEFAWPEFARRLQGVISLSRLAPKRAG
jgi:glycosyltransferase involved in cell wall biosynthesis